MTKKVITWVDRQGRYRVTSPAYEDPTRPPGETEAECIERVWTKIVAVKAYGIAADHPHFIVEDTDQRLRVDACCGNYFRYTGRADHAGLRDARGGAWEMDTDGRPKVNMQKARVIQMDKIRLSRDPELVALDIPFMRAVEAADVAEQQRIAALKQVLRDIPQTFKLGSFKTPATLRAAWPAELPRTA